MGRKIRPAIIGVRVTNNLLIYKYINYFSLRQISLYPFFLVLDRGTLFISIPVREACLKVCNFIFIIFILFVSQLTNRLLAASWQSKYISIAHLTCSIVPCIRLFPLPWCSYSKCYPKHFASLIF